MSIEMTRTSTVTFVKGQVYSDREISASQKALFLGNGWALENKAIAADPEDKAAISSMASAEPAAPRRGRPRKRKGAS